MDNFVTREVALQKAAEKLDISPFKYIQAMALLIVLART